MYRNFFIAFIINAAVLAVISTISIETRLGIKDIPYSNINSKDSLLNELLYYLRIAPYYFAKTIGLLTEKQTSPEWIKALYVFFISFIIALFVYHIFLVAINYNNMYRYFFGNFATLK